MSEMTDRFRALHQSGSFVLPNPWDVGSARILESLGAQALATTSSGQAATKGRYDQTITLDELLSHAEELVSAIGVPLNLDSERCFGEDPASVEANVTRMGDTGSAGCSIEDYNPATGGIDRLDLATERVAAAVQGAKASGMVVTARTENHLYGVDDLDDTIARLQAFAEAGAEVVYAPGLVDTELIGRVVDEVDRPVNVLVFANGPTVPELAAAGVRRVSTGSALLHTVHASLVQAGQELLDPGTLNFAKQRMTTQQLAAAFGPRTD